jgi:hypothetical protein
VPHLITGGLPKILQRHRSAALGRLLTDKKVSRLSTLKRHYASRCQLQQRRDTGRSAMARQWARRPAPVGQQRCPSCPEAVTSWPSHRSSIPAIDWLASSAPQRAIGLLQNSLRCWRRRRIEPSRAVIPTFEWISDFGLQNAKSLEPPHCLMKIVTERVRCLT